MADNTSLINLFVMKKEVKFAFQSCLHYFRIIMLIFGFSTILSLIPSLVIFLESQQGLSSNLEPLKLVTDFDRTIITEWLKNDHYSFENISNSFLVSLMLFVSFSILMFNGLIASITQQDNGVNNWYKNCLFYGIRLLPYNILLWIMSSLSIVLISSIFNATFGIDFSNFRTEIPILYSALFCIILIMFMIYFMWTWTLLAKQEFVLSKVYFKSLRLSWKKIWKNKTWLFQLFLLSLIIGLMNIAIIKYIFENVNASSFTKIILYFILGLILNFAKHLYKSCLLNFILQKGQ
jgi:hypothetical protein